MPANAGILSCEHEHAVMRFKVRYDVFRIGHFRMVGMTGPMEGDLTSYVTLIELIRIRQK